ncbi:ABC transporter permease [Mycolicibacterium goodii]|uniref:ABC transporter permease n=1 Tax=Mycolicibacterium goodii TaxID=134601 RepID=UPI000C261717|nr:ABC transporter permease [Mycolicibacterium goodii]PJK18208.1 diguanylate cyclase [Mycolicibacterium goodii]
MDSSAVHEVSARGPGARQRIRRVLANPKVSIPGAILLVIVVLAALSPIISPADYRDQVGFPLDTVGVMGTDDFGRDVLSRLLVGARTSLIVALLAVAIAAVLGVILGLVAGYRGGVTASAIMRSIDVLLSFPPVILAIAAVAILGPQLQNVILIIGVLYIPRFTRVVYTQVLSLKHADFVQAALSMGAPSRYILFKSLLPNIAAPIIVQLTLSLSFAIQIEAGLSFLGLGAQPPMPSLGTMVGAGRDYLEVQPSLLIYPALVIVGIVLCLNVLGDGLRDALDPRLNPA